MKKMFTWVRVSMLPVKEKKLDFYLDRKVNSEMERKCVILLEYWQRFCTNVNSLKKSEAARKEALCLYSCLPFSGNIIKSANIFSIATICWVICYTSTNFSQHRLPIIPEQRPRQQNSWVYLNEQGCILLLMNLTFYFARW